MPIYEVIVGNIGSIYCGTNGWKALQLFNRYKKLSRMQYGRAAGENVAVMKDGDVYYEYVGSLEQLEQEKERSHGYERRSLDR